MIGPVAKSVLLPYQLKVRNDRARWRIAVMPRQSGKDFLHMEEAVEMAMAKAKTDVLVSGPGERQALETLDKAKDWCEAYNYPIEDIRTDRETPQALVKAKSIHFANRSRIIAVPGTPALMRGYCAHTYITEFDFLENSFETFNAFFPSCTSPLKGIKKVRLYSTPMSKAGKLWQLLDRNLFNVTPGTKPEWSCHHLNIHECVAQGLKLDIETIRRALDDDEAFAREYLCEFRDSSNVLLPYDLIHQAESAEATEAIGSAYFDSRPRNPTYCGIDFGRVNDPTVCWTLEKAGTILWTREVLVLRNMPMPQQWELLQPRLRTAVKTCLDYTGIGVGLGDTAIAKFGAHNPAAHKFGRIEPCTFTPKLKRELFPHLRRAFEAPTTLRIPITIEIREDLHAMQQVVRNGEYDYYAPRTKDGHSDRCTALALAVRASETAPRPMMYPILVDCRYTQVMRERRNRWLDG